jgi:hypothetical protein
MASSWRPWIISNPLEEAPRPADDVTGDDPSGRSLFDRYAILIGLLDIDTEHGAHAELHPIYAMALRNTVNPETAANPRPDCWAMFARIGR